MVYCNPTYSYAHLQMVYVKFGGHATLQEDIVVYNLETMEDCLLCEGYVGFAYQEIGEDLHKSVSMRLTTCTKAYFWLPLQSCDGYTM